MRKGPLMAEHTVRSPLPGVFYRSPSPTAPPFVEVGSSVTADDTIGMIEIMKQFAEVKAGADGSLTAFAVENEATVGPGDPIATIAAG
jgi:acetyl-CoA carboxylase biotin carboxyl carrier protein